MAIYLLSFLASFTFLVIVTPFIIKMGIKYNIVDQVNSRKIHRGKIPRIGGIGITIGTLLAPVILLVTATSPEWKEALSGRSIMIVVIGGGGAISLLGLIDDVWGVRARWKFLFQIGIASLAWYFGFSITGIFTPFGAFEFGIFALPVTVLWIVAIINAFNLIDGIDGLSSGVAFFASLTMFILSMHNGHTFAAIFSASMAGAVVGFLLFNFNPAKIFMGDSGSMFLGYMLAVISIQGGNKGNTIISILVPIIAMGLPILDTGMAIIRRFFRNQPLFQADKQHIHHILLNRGWTQRKVVISLYGITILFTALALVTIFLKDSEVFLIVTVFSIIVFVFITRLGYMNMFYNRFSQRKENKLESRLMQAYEIAMQSLSLAEIDKMVAELPFVGWEVISESGKTLIKKGEDDPIQFLDITYDKEGVVRFFWKENVPTINAREAVLMELLAKGIAHCIIENRCK
ncbi:undecaprenyl/decaprenyl-phosphate alpha-N-acetylglucosaminyl 1-phosphate transferase [bacterium]|nr:undecaprenyl/decaprenyl-phosphate alpha-N-acetylglucosaminyl 1-phosphate transferase [bacterium]